MKTSQHKYFNGTVETKFELSVEDFDYLAKEFKISKSLNGFDLESIANPKLSIHINSYSIKYDRDISERRMMIATERVDISNSILYSIGNEPHNFKQFIPTTTNQLAELVDEFKYRPMGDVTKEEIINFLK